MDVSQEVSSTCETEVADEHIILELDASSSCNEISLAEAANALITLQVPGKDTITSSTSPSERAVRESATRSNDEVVSSSPQDIRKKILEGMKSQFNTKDDDDAVSDQTGLMSRRSLNRVKAKPKSLGNEELDEDSHDVSTPTRKPLRGRGRPPKSQPDMKGSPVKVLDPEVESLAKGPNDSGSEAGSERSIKSPVSVMSSPTAVVTTRRSQRTVIRTSAAELLKGNMVRKSLKRSVSETDVSGVEKTESTKHDQKKKRGRPSRAGNDVSVVPQSSATELPCATPEPVANVLPGSENSISTIEDKPPSPVESRDPVVNATVSSVPDTLQKMEHMASLGLQSKTGLALKTSVKKRNRQRGRFLLGPKKNVKNSSAAVTHNGSGLWKETDGKAGEVAEENEPRITSALETRMEDLMQSILTKEKAGFKEIRVNVDAPAALVNGSTHSPRAQTKNSPVQQVSKIASGEEDYLCLCLEGRPPLVAQTKSAIAATLYCQAVDSVGGKLVGCCRTACSRKLFRPAVRVPYMLLCDSHKERLKKHFCCPGCGFFCTQGLVLQCQDPSGSYHFYHTGCRRTLDGKGVCPHCGRSDSSKEVRLQMKTFAVPVFCSDSKLLKTVPTAKITMAKTVGTELSNAASGCPTFLSPKLVLPSGKEVTAQGMPNTLDKRMLETILKSLTCASTTSRSSNGTSLYLAAKQGDVEKIIECLRSGHNVDSATQDSMGQTALHAACYGGHLAAIHVIVQSGASLDVLDESQMTPLMIAVQEGHNDAVKYLIQASASISLKGEGGMTVLHIAAKCGNLEAVHYVMSCRTSKQLLNSQDDGGWTPLVWGCEHQRIHIVRYLLQCKADPLVRDAELNTALHWAAFSGSMDIASLLLDSSCDINATNLHGDTPLHIAGRRDNYECVLLFLTRGANLHLKNKDGHTPVQVCLDDTSHSALLLTLNAKLQRITQSKVTGGAEKLVSNDITNGKEANPIQCFNGIDSEPPAVDYVYVVENCFTSPIHVDRTINSLKSCRCEDGCSTERCSCSSLSFRCWYDEEGKLVPEFNFSDPPMLFECNRACGCHRALCNNRVVQHGISARLALFRTAHKGWGVRTSHTITKGTYVCEYVGEIISDFEADQREDDSYLFDLDNKDGETYCIDARRYGNIARFINHSCEPSLIPVKVFVDHQDLKFPRIAFFAGRDIQANEELTFDYGDKFWIIKYKSFTCACSSPKCKYSQLTIHHTVEEYNKSLLEGNLVSNEK